MDAYDYDVMFGRQRHSIRAPRYSGNGLSFVSGAKGSVNNPTRKIAHIVMAE